MYLLTVEYRFISVIKIFEGGSADDFHGDVNVRKDGPVDGLTTCRFHRKFLMEKLDLETSFFLFIYLFIPLFCLLVSDSLLV